MQHQDFVDAHGTGRLVTQVDGWKAVRILETTPAVPLELGRGYRWQRLSAVACLVCAVPLLLGLPLWACLVIAAVGLPFRDWGVVTGGLFAAAVVWYGEWELITGALCLLCTLYYGWQAMRDAKVDLVRLALGRPDLYERARQNRAILPDRTAPAH